MGLQKVYLWPKKLYQFITNLFVLANIIPHREESHTQLPLQLVHWCSREIFTLAILHLHRGTCRKSTKKQVCSKLDLEEEES